MQIITTSTDLTAAIATLKTAPVIAVDTEFMREKTYWPQLCLVQIASQDGTFLIDPLPNKLDLHPLAELWGSASIHKIFHAGGQDVQILYDACGVAPAPYFDTQDAAALIGLPEQIGYGALIQRLLHVELAKADSFTDWSRRPLTDTQVDYAAEDVSWLLKVYPVLYAELQSLGRETWLDEEFARRVSPAALEIDLRAQFRRLKRVASLKPHQLAIARELAAWREEEAMRRDLPKRWLLSDEAILEIARKAPGSAEELARLRGVGASVKHSLDRIVSAVQRGQRCPQEDWPSLPERRKPEGDFAATVDLMAALVRKRAQENRLSTSLLAPRALLESYALEHDESSPLMQGWRRALIGEELTRLLDGEIGLCLRDKTLTVEECPRSQG